MFAAYQEAPVCIGPFDGILKYGPPILPVSIAEEAGRFRPFYSSSVQEH
jgi:hypothetical protein